MRKYRERHRKPRVSVYEKEGHCKGCGMLINSMLHVQYPCRYSQERPVCMKCLSSHQGDSTTWCACECHYNQLT